MGSEGHREKPCICSAPLALAKERAARLMTGTATVSTMSRKNTFSSTWPKEKRFLPTVIFRTFLSYHTPVPVSFLDTPWVISTSTTPTTPLSRPTAVETSY